MAAKPAQKAAGLTPVPGSASCSTKSASSSATVRPDHVTRCIHPTSTLRRTLAPARKPIHPPASTAPAALAPRAARTLHKAPGPAQVRPREEDARGTRAGDPGVGKAAPEPFVEILVGMIGLIVIIFVHGACLRVINRNFSGRWVQVTAETRAGG